MPTPDGPQFNPGYRLSPAEYALFRETGHVGDVHPEWGERGTDEYKENQKAAWLVEEQDEMAALDHAK